MSVLLAVVDISFICSSVCSRLGFHCNTTMDETTAALPDNVYRLTQPVQELAEGN